MEFGECYALGKSKDWSSLTLEKEDIRQFKRFKANSSASIHGIEETRLKMVEDIYEKYLKGNDAIFQVSYSLIIY